MFGGYSAHLCAVDVVGTYGHSSEQHYRRRDRPPLVRSVGKLLCSSVALTLSADWHMYNPLLCYLPLPYCWGGCCLFFLYGWRRHPLLCYPPLPYCWGGCCPFFMRLAARSSTVLPRCTTPRVNATRFSYGRRRHPLLCYPPLHYCWGGCCPFFRRLAARTSTVLPPLTLLLGRMLPVFYTVGCAIVYCATPLHYT